MYIGFIYLYLITSDLRTFTDILNPLWGSFTDKDNNEIDAKSYCDVNPCLVKCCEAGKAIDSGGNCADLNYVKISVGNESIAKQDLHIAESAYTMIDAHNVPLLSALYAPTEAHILEDGSLKMKINYPKERWIEAPPLSFCYDFSVNMTENLEQSPLIFRLIDQYRIQAINQLVFVAAGMLLSLLIALVLVCRIKPRIRQTIAPIVIALTLTAVLGYTLKIIQLASLSAGIPQFSECSIFSPIYYFFMLSNFFWPNILFFDLYWRMRCFRKNKRNFHHRDMARFVFYCLCAWGVPLLTTVSIEAVNILDLNQILSLEKPPFNNCFTNELQTMLYLHVPAVILTIATCVPFSMLMYHCITLRRKLMNSPTYKKIGSPEFISTHLKVRICFKPVTGIALFYLMSLIPDLPSLPFTALIVSSLYFWALLFFIFVFDLSIFTNVSKRCRPYHHLSEKFQASEFLKTVALNTTGGALTEGLKKGNDKEKLIDNNNTIDL